SLVAPAVPPSPIPSPPPAPSTRGTERHAPFASHTCSAGQAASSARQSVRHSPSKQALPVGQSAVSSHRARLVATQRLPNSVVRQNSSSSKSRSLLQRGLQTSNTQTCDSSEQSELSRQLSTFASTFGASAFGSTTVGSSMPTIALHAIAAMATKAQRTNRCSRFTTPLSGRGTSGPRSARSPQSHDLRRSPSGP